MNERESAREALRTVLPAGWALGPPTWHREAGRWQVWAIGARPIRLRAPEQVGGAGETETDALRDLTRNLRTVRA